MNIPRLLTSNNKVFKKGKDKYKINYIIRTDAISICVLFRRLNENGIPISKEERRFFDKWLKTYDGSINKIYQ